MVLIPLNVGHDLLIGLGQGLLPSGEQIVGIQQGFTKQVLVIAPLQHPKIRKSEGDEILGHFVKTGPRLRVVGSLDLRTVQVNRGFDEEVGAQRLEV